MPSGRYFEHLEGKDKEHCIGAMMMTGRFQPFRQL